jgi:hypothetical protein
MSNECKPVENESLAKLTEDVFLRLTELWASHNEVKFQMAG